MPRVKFDYVVSFSSEDPDNQATNLLATEVSKKKWLCSKGEPSCSVVLQMTKAAKISAVHIGAYQASLVEVLVGRSESPNDPYQVLVASNVFLSPSESRREQSAERVRSFTADQLSSPARDQRWDRLRVVCSQPYNKHCKYGLSFVHIFEPEGADASRCPAVPSRLLNLDTFSSDEDEYRPGELFAKHLESSQSDENENSTSAEVQIRQASSQAIRNISDSATKLKKTPLPKPTRRSNLDSDRSTTDRQRESLLYEDDDDKPNSKVDRVLQQHLTSKAQEESQSVVKTAVKVKKIGDMINSKKQDRNRNTEHKPVSNRAPHSGRDRNVATSSDTGVTRKRTHSDTRNDPKGAGCDGGGAAPHELLRGVVLVFSGYVNPQRARLRTAALALGARVRPDWDDTCTHLICAFPNTPKLRAVRGRAGGGAVPVARGAWLEQCAARRRLLPWQWFATEDSRRVTPPPDTPDPDPAPAPAPAHTHSECDTDDEIEKVLRKQKKRRPDNPRDREGKREQEGEGERTEPDTDLEDNVQIEESKALPDFFEGLRFVVSRDCGDVTAEVERYVRAYAGLLLDEVQVSEGAEPDYRVSVSGEGRGCRGVRPEWVWRCHAERRLCARADDTLA